MKNTYTLKIAGTSFSIVSDEPEKYIRSLESRVDEMVQKALLRGASSHKAALFVCMELCDMLNKASQAQAEPAKKSKKTFDEIIFPNKDQTTLF